MRFKEIFSRSVKDYRINVRAIIAVVLVFLLIPTLISFLISYGFSQSEGGKAISAESKAIREEYQPYENIDVNQLSEEQKNAMQELSARQINLLLKQSPYLILSLFISIVVMIASFYGFIGLISGAFKTKFSYSDAIKGSRKYFWRSLGLCLILMVFLMLILLVMGIVFMIGFVIFSLSKFAGSIILPALIIAFIAFFVWFLLNIIFSNYILIDENKKIFQSIRDSFKLIKDKRWSIFGKIILIFLCSLPIFIIFIIAQIILGGIDFWSAYNSKIALESNLYVSTINIIWTLLYQFILSPFYILFFKNLYLDLKKDKPKK